jgi:hypothetical protein
VKPHCLWLTFFSLLLPPMLLLLLCLTENILERGAFTEKDWWETVSVEYQDDASDKDTEEEVQTMTVERTFRNRGHETFLVVQKAWREAEGTLDQPPSPSYSLRQEMSKSSKYPRYKGLPKKVSLKDVIDLYSERWSGTDPL